MVSFTAGLGEFIGQALRILTGIIADKTKKYWFMMIIGYAINLLVIPLLAFVDASIWQVAIILILIERVGKAIRAPAKSALTSFTSPHLGAGKAFAIQEALDQLGAFLGPLFVFLVLSLRTGSQISGYQLAFGLLGIFAVLTLVVLVMAKVKYPHPDEFETKTLVKGFKGNKSFVWYLIAISFLAFGFIDYPVIGYHLSTAVPIEVEYIPLLYSFAMGIDAISALFFGHMYDKIGVKALMISTFVSLLFAPVFFLVPGLVGIIVGVFLWGIGMGAQESILKAVVSGIVSKDKRATAYGIFNSVFGLSWFLGSMMIGYLYQVQMVYVIAFSVITQAISILLLVYFNRIHPFQKEVLS
ncbi:MAG: MFS transporter [Candidatus Izemoplasmatales bacterium]|nr:MFS transporter [Candidatus Izemoplasmatales bacterium]